MHTINALSLMGKRASCYRTFDRLTTGVLVHVDGRHCLHCHLQNVYKAGADTGTPLPSMYVENPKYSASNTWYSERYDFSRLLQSKIRFITVKCDVDHAGWPCNRVTWICVDMVYIIFVLMYHKLLRLVYTRCFAIN